MAATDMTDDRQHSRPGADASRIVLDGAAGEGGGQILRTALGLSAATGRPFTIHSIRAGRSRPGLMRQHLTGVQAVAAVSGATVTGAEVGSTQVTFDPGPVQAGDYRFEVGTAGSATLVLQAVLPALLTADAPSVVTVTGGTHNPWAPPFPFLDRCFAPILGRMGGGLDLSLIRPGFFPAGGGELRAVIKPGPLTPIRIEDRGALVRRRAEAWLSNLDREVAVRELDTVRRKLGFHKKELEIVTCDAHGPGNLLTIEHEFEHVTELETGFGERGVRAERVAGKAIKAVREWLGSGAPVGAHLADQLLIPLALAGGGGFWTLRPTAHTRTNAEVVSRFLPVDFEIAELAERPGLFAVNVKGRT